MLIQIQRAITLTAVALTLPRVSLAPIISKLFLPVIVLPALVPYQIAAIQIRRALDLTDARTEQTT